MFHLAVVHGVALGEASYETDRGEFVGRGRTLADPAAMHVAKLSNREGSVLDPILAIRRAVTVEPDATICIDFVTGVADTRDAVMALIEKYQDSRMADRVFDLAWTHSGTVLRQLGAAEEDAQLYGRLAGTVLYADRAAAPRAASFPATGADSPACGATESPATCRSCSSASVTRRISSSCDSSLKRMLTGGRRG